MCGQPPAPQGPAPADGLLPLRPEGVDAARKLPHHRAALQGGLVLAQRRRRGPLVLQRRAPGRGPGRRQRHAPGVAAAAEADPLVDGQVVPSAQPLRSGQGGRPVVVLPLMQAQDALCGTTCLTLLV